MGDDWESDRDEAKPVALPPAPAGLRLAAGAVDLFLLGLLTAGLFLVPLSLGGFVLPMLAVFAAVVGYAVVPMWLFRATLGMRLFGLEIVGRDGRDADLVELMFREFVGRGMFAAAYLGTYLLGLLGMLLGTARLAAPEGMAAVLTQLAVAMLVMAGAGHLLILASKDGRGLADHVGRTQVTTRRPEPLPSDPEERADVLAARKARIVRYAVFAALLVAGGIGAPWVLGSRSSEVTGGGDRMARIKLKQLHADFELNPSSGELARELTYALLASGDEAAAEKVQVRHRVALEEKQAQRAADRLDRLRAMRESFDADPTDEATGERLFEAYEEDGNVVEARAVYAKLVEADPGRRAGFGMWLYESDLPAEAAVALRQAIAEGVDPPSVKAYLGFALLDTGEKEQAREALQQALAADPELDEVREALVALEAELGPEKGAGASAARR